MRKTLGLMLFVFVLFFMSGCRRVIETPADELTSKSWICENKSTVSARLSFDGSFAKLTIESMEDGATCDIYGRYAVDSEKLYITDDELLRTYEFSYEVFRDRVYISYGENTLEFSADNTEFSGK